MKSSNPLTLLLVLVCTVPLVVGAAGLASFLLLRAGYGYLVGGGLPLLACLLIAGVLGALLGGIASRDRVRKADKARNGGTDDV